MTRTGGFLPGWQDASWEAGSTIGFETGTPGGKWWFAPYGTSVIRSLSLRFSGILVPQDTPMSILEQFERHQIFLQMGASKVAGDANVVQETS